MDTAGSRLDPHLAAADHAVQAPLPPEVRAVDAEGANALRRDVEAVRLGDCEQRQGPSVSDFVTDAVSDTVSDTVCFFQVGWECCR